MAVNVLMLKKMVTDNSWFSSKQASKRSKSIFMLGVKQVTDLN